MFTERVNFGKHRHFKANTRIRRYPVETVPIPGARSATLADAIYLVMVVKAQAENMGKSSVRMSWTEIKCNYSRRYRKHNDKESRYK